MKYDERGSLNILLIPFILLTIFFIGALSFGIWSYMGMQDWKTNAQPKINAAVAVAEANTSSAKENEFVQREKEPLTTWNGPADYGSIEMKYPKTWSGYVAVATTGGDNPINAWFHPHIVPSTVDPGKTFALRVQVLNKSFTDTLRDYQTKQQSGDVTASAYALPNEKDVVGVMLKGKVDGEKVGTMVVLPLRDKTIKIWTHGTDYEKDYTDIILANFKFSR